MRFSTFAVLAASAALAHVSAAPAIRLVVVSGSVEEDNPLRGLRFGHAVQPMPPYRNTDGDHDSINLSPIELSDSLPPTDKGPGDHPAPPKRFRHRPGCHGKKGKFAIFMHRIKIKAIKVGNCFRKALGWPLIEPNHHHRHRHHHHHHHHHKHPHDPQHGKDKETDDTVAAVTYRTGVPEGDHSGHKEHHNRFFRNHNGSFLSRLHHSLMNLGRWEGRAVAFVIGCGIGVLIRMFWVLAIVSYRAFRGSHDAAVTVVEEYDSDDEIVVSPKAQPPKYIYPVDEKIAVEESN